MSDAGVLPVPVVYIADRTVLTPPELVYGYRQGWLSDADVVALALAAYQQGPVPAAEEELALLLSDDLDRVPDLIDELEADGETAEGGEARGVWLYLALAWLYEHRSEVPDPLGVVEMLFADFDYPLEIAGIVRFMPVPPGEPTGSVAVENRWRAYLDHKAQQYASRRSSA